MTFIVGNSRAVVIVQWTQWFLQMCPLWGLIMAPYQHLQRCYWAILGLGRPIWTHADSDWWEISNTALVFILAIYPVSSVNKTLTESFSVMGSAAGGQSQ